MKTRANTRLLVIALLIFIGILLLSSIFSRSYSPFHRQTIDTQNLQYAIDDQDEFKVLDNEASVKVRLESLKRLSARPSCRMETCFDFDKCARDFKIYVYPFENGERVSTGYAKIIRVIKKSIYYTEDPRQACLYIPSYDTLDRDRLSSDYVSHLGRKLWSLPHWNGGRNHVIFIMYSGTWPDYKEELILDSGQAVLAKASMSIDKYRQHFDISLPLFPKTHSHFGGGSLPHTKNVFPVLKRYRLVFKGKRYLTGVGSESRNSLYHIHNDRDMIMLTTCKHGRNWRNVKDKRCDKDNELYDSYDYNELMGNTSFCLVPRGRRLGSYRFLESLQFGCIPLILSNGWKLPFEDTIDWKKAAVFADERLLTLIPTIVRSFSYKEILEMKQQVLFLWDAYFSSVDKIVHTIIETIYARVNKHMAKQYQMWNSFPGSLHLSSSFSRKLQDYPFFYQETGLQAPSKFTAVIYATSPVVKESSSMHKLIRTVAKSPYVAKIVVLWTAGGEIPARQNWPSVNVTIAVVKSAEQKNRNSRMMPRTLIETDVILSLDEDINLNIDEINFAFLVWRKFPQRIVGFPCRSHSWDQGLSKWLYSSQWKNECSMISTSAAFYHRFYNYYYTHRLPSSIHHQIAASNTCEDIAMNFVVAHVARQPPIKVLGRKPYKEYLANLYRRQSATKDHYSRFETRKTCFEAFSEEFGYMPLIHSNARFDPVLYKDPISNFRKRYRLLEQ